MRKKKTLQGFRGGAALAGALVLLAVSTVPAAGQEKTPGEKPLVFKSRVINAPNAAGSVQGVVAEVLREAYAKSKGAPLTKEQHGDLMVRLERAFRLNRSDEGLKEVLSRNGTVGVDLQGRYQHIYVARTNPDGTTSIACVTDWESARAYLAGTGGVVPTAEKE